MFRSSIVNKIVSMIPMYQANATFIQLASYSSNKKIKKSLFVVQATVSHSEIKPKLKLQTFLSKVLQFDRLIFSFSKYPNVFTTGCCCFKQLTKKIEYMVNLFYLLLAYLFYLFYHYFYPFIDIVFFFRLHPLIDNALLSDRFDGVNSIPDTAFSFFQSHYIILFFVFYTFEAMH